MKVAKGRLSDKNSSLTRREAEVCRLLALGYTNAEVAVELQISPRTVETHRTRIMTKIGATRRRELVRFAIQHRLLGRSVQGA